MINECHFDVVNIEANSTIVPTNGGNVAIITVTVTITNGNVTGKKD